MSEPLTDEQIAAAVEWWSEALCHAKYENLGPGERHTGSEMASELASASHQLPTDSQLGAFKQALAECLREKGKPYPIWSLGVDYGPDKILGDAANAAGIRLGTFPWKTAMWFEHGGVQVQYGYGAAMQDVLPKTVRAKDPTADLLDIPDTLREASSADEEETDA